MAFGVYVHIPYCIQRCHYCDFTTFEQHQILPKEEYLDLLLQEIKSRHKRFSPQRLTSLYFGGGTPSLFPTSLLSQVISALKSSGFSLDETTEVTIEINPATIDEAKLDSLLAVGFNRFSLGAQTFSDQHLKTCGREHSAADTIQTLNLLRSRNLNFSLDLLFALPGQSLQEVQLDVKTALRFQPPHISTYCLTVPQNHPMSTGRAPEGQQVQMFRLIEAELGQCGMVPYELSNFAKPGYESQHNSLYWSDHSYWGVGLSAHSYDNSIGFGLRFWNSKNLKTYALQANFSQLPREQQELLLLNEALTDFCHTRLRTAGGLSLDALRCKFSDNLVSLVFPRLKALQDRQLLSSTGDYWSLTREGRLLSNKVFLELTFLPEEITAPGLDSLKL